MSEHRRQRSAALDEWTQRQRVDVHDIEGPRGHRLGRAPRERGRTVSDRPERFRRAGAGHQRSPEVKARRLDPEGKVLDLLEIGRASCRVRVNVTMADESYDVTGLRH